MKVSRFEELDIWKEARELYKHVFLITSKEPFCNDFRFRDQIRASSGSVSDNIAEACLPVGRVLIGAVTRSLFSFFPFQKVLVVKFAVSLIEHLTVIILKKKNLMNCLTEQIVYQEK